MPGGYSGPDPDEEYSERIPEHVPTGRYVVNKSGKHEAFHPDKITTKIQRNSEGLDIDVERIIKDVLNNFVNGCSTVDLDHFAMKTALNLPTHNLDYKKLACRLFTEDLHRRTPKKFSEATKILGDWGVLDPAYTKFVLDNAEDLDSIIDDSADKDFTFTSLSTWNQLYLLKKEKEVIERPQYLFLRVAVALYFPFTHEESCECFKCKGIPEHSTKVPFAKTVPGKITPEILETIRKVYHDLAVKKLYMHATPTLFNCGTKCGQLSSCFLLTMQEDSIDGIYGTLFRTAKISQGGGGVGLNVTPIRSAGSRIVTTNGISNGLMPMLKVFNDTARYVDQCFVPGTIVYTLEGPKKIEDVVQGERLLTIDGSFQAVKNIVRHEVDTDTLYVHTCLLEESTTLTPEHQVLSLKNPHGLSVETLRNQVIKDQKGFDFVDAKDLEVGDFVVFPVPKESIDSHFTQNDLRFYGLLLSAGIFSQNRAALRIPPNQDSTIEFVSSYLKDCGVHIQWGQASGLTQISWSLGHPRFPFNEVMIRNGIIPSLKNLPQEKAVYLIKGILELGARAINDYVQVTGKPDLNEDLRYQLLRLGILCRSMNKRETLLIPLCIELIRAIPQLPWRKSCQTTDFFRIKDCLITKIGSISHSKYSGIVHDFEIEGNQTYVTQAGCAHNGGGKRKGAFAIYLEPWHADFLEVLEAKLPEGDDNVRSRDLFYAIWNNDVFMERLEASEFGTIPVSWSFFCPKEHPELMDLWGDAFKKRYTELEAEGKAKKIVDIWQDVWTKILYVQQKTGGPYMLHKDTINRRNNQDHVGTIKCSNLCTEIVEYTAPDEVAVCNLASIILASCLKKRPDGKFEVDDRAIIEAAGQLVRNINQVIDRTRYPLKEAYKSNFRHRYIGIGCQGLADVFQIIGIPYTSVEAQELTHRIFEAMYFGALRASVDLAKEHGPYPTYEGSKLSRGILIFDEVRRPKAVTPEEFPSSDFWDPYNEDGTVKTFQDWTDLRQDLDQYGAYNAQLIAPMPTVSTAKLTGNNDSFEPYTSNIIATNTLAGSSEIINPHMVRVLKEKGLWTPEIYEKIVAAGGSLRNIDEIDDKTKKLFETVWELSSKKLIYMAHIRQIFIDQSQSFNIYLEDPDFLTAVHILAWNLMLKTGMYYLHTRVEAQAMKVKQTSETKEATTTNKRKASPDGSEKPAKKPAKGRAKRKAETEGAEEPQKKRGKGKTATPEEPEKKKSTKRKPEQQNQDKGEGSFQKTKTDVTSAVAEELEKKPSEEPLFCKKDDPNCLMCQ